ncbi:MAG: 30S ribosomal protein S20 [Oscillospiraceae bacterium]
MPNIKSQKDRVIQAKKEALRNKAVKSNLKTVIKKADVALAGGSADSLNAVVTAVSTIDKACSKGVLHKNTAARKVAQVMKKANAAKA